MPDEASKIIRHADGDKMRERILQAITDADRPFNTWAELADAIGTSDSNIQYHVQRLRKMGRVTYENRRPWTLHIQD